MSNRTTKAWLVAASIGAVEALKDQGFCRWNYAMRAAQQHAARSYATQGKKLSPVSTKTTSQQQKLKQSEESLRKVMYLSCWAPN